MANVQLGSNLGVTPPFTPPAPTVGPAKAPVEVTPTAPVVTGPPSAAVEDRARATVGNVASRDQLPTTMVVAKYGGPRSGTQASALLDKGFALDQANQPTKALAQYDKAAPLLRKEIADALGDRLAEKGLPASDFLALSPTAEPMIVGFLSRSGLFDELPAGLQETTLRYFNRKGLAYKHEGDAGMAAIYCMQAVELRPTYGPAHYNLACATTKMENANGPTNIAQRNGEALDHLERAIEADKPFFTKLALSDPDWNTLRNDARFRDLVGLPA